MTNRSEASGEDSLIARYFKPLATDPGAFGLIDDAAILNTSGEDVVVKTDAIVEGVHFLPDDPPDTVARKALRVNLSDLAAKGATPAGFVLTLALRRESLAHGFRASAGRRCQPIRLPAAWRRHCIHTGTGDDLDRRAWSRSSRQDGPPQRCQTRRPRHGYRDDRRCLARPKYP
jgi:hypothetical protein